MRAFRTTLAAACLAGVAPAWSMAADYTPEQILGTFKPSFKGVDYDSPADAAALAACKVEKIPNAKGETIGYAVRDGQGKLLRRVVNIRPGINLDQWSYYQDGFEVYREVDLNEDKVIDEARWMNAAGTRVAKIARGKIASWERISAEEASKVVVQALVGNDADLLGTVMATPADLEALGVPKGEVDAVALAEKNRASAFAALRKSLVGWDDAGTTWLGITAGLPHLIPADSGLKADLFLHENASIFAGTGDNSGAGRTSFLQVGEIVRVGDCWKLVDLPRPVDPKSGVVASFDGGIRSAVFREGGAPAASENPQVAAAMNALAAHDKAKADLLNGTPQQVATFHVGRVAPLGAVVKAADAAGDAKVALDHQKLIVDSLAAALSTGAYPAAAQVLEQYAAKGGKVGSYAAYRQIEAEFVLQNSNDPGNVMNVQDAWLGKLKGFVEKYPQSEEFPSALMLLGSTNELNGREADARKFYGQLVQEAPSTEWGKKAAGALRRLDAVGKPLALAGTDLRGQAVDATSYRGKTLLVLFWATSAEPARKDLPELAKLYAKHKAKGFEVIAVNLDADRADLDAFHKQNPLPWREIHEAGGLEGRLATEFGIISLPTMLLVDPDGRVRDRNLRTAAEAEILLDKAFAAKGDGGVALRPK